MKLTTLAVSSVLALAVSATASAHPPGPPHHDPTCQSPRAKAALAKYDANKNGRLDRDERRAMRDDKRQAALAKYDANGDGRLDDKERARLHHDKTVEHFDEIDTSGDAEISRAEADAACGPLKYRFDRVDADGNGSVSWSEFESAVKKKRARKGRRGPPPHRAPAD